LGSDASRKAKEVLGGWWWQLVDITT
jgi:hypothetical protein